MGIVESRDCRCKFDSKERPRIQVVPLDDRGFSPYACIQKNQSEATGMRKRQDMERVAGHVAFS
jgi:hypothetical protein